MKWILIFLCLPVFGQLPVLPFAPTPSASIADYTNTIYVDLQSDTTASLANFGSGNVVTVWTNIAPIALSHPNIMNLTTPGGAVYPTYSASSTPTGKPAVNWSANNSALNSRMNVQFNGSNQPNFMCFVFKIATTQGGRIFDCPNGGRNIVGCTDTSLEIFAGSDITTTTASIVNNWLIYSIVVNGANSYIRTNGVVVAKVSPGANALGDFAMGNDNTLVTPFKGLIAAMRVYQESPTTNNLHIVEQNLATRYLGITLPSP